MSGVGGSAPGESIHDLLPADTMEVVDSADSGPVVEAKDDIGAQEGASSSCAAASETSASTVGTGAEQASATASAEGGSSGVAEELTKVTVFNVGMHATSAQLEKLLKKNGIAYKRARKPPSISHAILTFETEDQRTSGMEQIGKLRGPRGGELMYAVLTKHNTNKRGAEGGGRGGDGSKRPRQEEAKTVAQATASLYGVKTYAEQLAFKEQTLMDDLFFRLPALIRKEWDKRYGEWKRNQGIKQGKQPGGGGGGKLTSPPELKCPSWCRTFKRRNGTVPFDVLPIVASPEQEGYRNKCEFTISLGADGLATTGFRAGRFNADVPITVESPKDCPQVHRDMKTLCVQMDAFMRTSPFLPYEDTSKKGVWRFLLVRRSVADNETMAKLVVNLTGVAETEEWKKEEQRLVKELSEGAQGQEGTRLVSLWIQEYAGVSSPDETSPLRLLWGKERIEEKLLGLRFTISPNSFFQVNTQGAEALYRVVIENLELGDDVMVLDVCCGAGTIGICAAAAGGAKRVFGADLCLPAIEDAKVNAEANGIKNCEFVCGKAEAVVGGQIARAIKQHKQESREAAAEAVAAAEGSALEATADGAPPKEPVCSELKFAAVVDPPRSGVHAKCLRSLRGTKAIKRLVYVSCNPTKSLPADALILCCPVSNSTVGVPFRPVKAIPVDMFPHTPHMELVMVFERVEPETEQAPPSAAEPAAEPAAQQAVKPAEATVTGGASPDAPPGGVAHHSLESPIPVADHEAGGASGAGEASEASEAGEAAAKASEVAKASAVVQASEGVKVSEDATRVSEAAGAGEAAEASEAAAAPSEAAKASADAKASEETKAGEEA